MNHCRGVPKPEPNGTVTANGYKVDFGGVEISWNSATVRISQPCKCAKNTEVYVTPRKWIAGYVNYSSVKLSYNIKEKFHLFLSMPVLTIAKGKF